MGFRNHTRRWCSHQQASRSCARSRSIHPLQYPQIADFQRQLSRYSNHVRQWQFASFQSSYFTFTQTQTLYKLIGLLTFLLRKFAKQLHAKADTRTGFSTCLTRSIRLRSSRFFIASLAVPTPGKNSLSAASTTSGSFEITT